MSAEGIARACAELARDVAAYLGDLLRLYHARNPNSPAHRDARFTEWYSAEARAAVEQGLEADAWTPGDVDRLAQQIRASIVAERTGVRRIAGTPRCVAAPDVTHRPGEPLFAPPGGPAPWIQLATAAGIGRELWDEDCDSWVQLPRDLPRARYVALNVRGDSMLPLIHDGDVVLVRMESSADEGDIVLARTEDGYVIKRLARVSTAGVRLESLNPDYEAMTIRDIPNPIVGTVVLRWCAHDAGTGTAA